MSSVSPEYVSNLITSFFYYLSRSNYYYLLLCLTQWRLNWSHCFHYFSTTVEKDKMIFFKIRNHIISFCLNPTLVFHCHSNKPNLYHSFQVFIESELAHVLDLNFSLPIFHYTLLTCFCSIHIVNLHLPRTFFFFSTLPRTFFHQIFI